MTSVIDKFFPEVDVTPTWTRHPDWLPMPSVSPGDQKIAILQAVFDNPLQYAAVTVAGAYTVDWGDGSTPENFATGIAGQHIYNYADLEGTDVSEAPAQACTFQDTGDTVTLNNHGWHAGARVNFSSITSTTGISTNTRYFIVNPTTNTFQVASTRGGTPLTLTTDGSGLVFVTKYRQAMIIITPQGGQNLTSLACSRHTATSSRYESGRLDVLINSPNISTITLYATSLWFDMCERIQVPQHNCTSWITTARLHTGLKVFSMANTPKTTTAANMFSGNYSLVNVGDIDFSSATTTASAYSGLREITSFPNVNAINATTIGSMFLNCTFLKKTPSITIDTTKMTTASSVFSGCTRLEKALDMDLSGVCNTVASLFATCSRLIHAPNIQLSTTVAVSAASMYSGCVLLEDVPWMNTVNVTNSSSMFATCVKLKTIPDMDWSSVTNASNMFLSCNSLRRLPFLDLSSATNIATLFSGCNSLEEVFLDISAATTTTTPFLNCGSLRRISGPMPAVSFSVANCLLDADALNEIYTNLPNATATITVTGNPGISGHDTSIATNKGWTVTTV